MEIGKEANTVNGFPIEGLILEGAVLVSGIIRLTDELRCVLPRSQLTWLPRNDLTNMNTITLPLYLNEGRVSLISEIHVEISKDVSKVACAQRGVSILAQSNL